MVTILLTTIRDDGQINNKRHKGVPSGYHATLIAFELNRLHAGVPTTQLIDLVKRESSKMGLQVAFVDEGVTFVATEF